MTNSRSLFFSNAVETPDLGRVPFLDWYYDRLEDAISLALDPIENFAHFIDGEREKSQEMKDIISILYALHRNARSILTQFDDNLTRHAGEISVLKYCHHNSADETPEKAMGVEIRQYSREQEVVS